MKMTDTEAMSPSTEDAIKYLGGMIFPQDFSPSTLRAVAVNEMAIAALRAQLECEKEHIGETTDMMPLTLDELREMDGEPVYIQRIPYNYGEWHICHGERKYKRHGHAVISMGNGWLEIEEEYGKTWLAYRNELKEAQS